MWEIVIFIDNPISPILPWEHFRGGEKDNDCISDSVWRMHVVGRIPIHNKWTYVPYRDTPVPIGQCKQLWLEYGLELRRIAVKLALNSERIFVYDHCVNKESSLFTIQESHKWKTEKPGSELGAIKYPANTQSGDVYRFMNASQFLTEQWPLTSGTATFLSTQNSILESQYFELLSSGNFNDAEKLAYGTRFDIELLSEVFKSASLYLFAYLTFPPESYFPWFFISKQIPAEYAISIATNELRSANTKVYISHSVQSSFAWQENGSIPDDAILIC